jgi:hypothetical protein
MKQQLGFPKSIESVSEATLIPFFIEKDKFEVKSFSVGKENSLVSVVESDNQKNSLGLRLYKLD